MNEFGMMTSIMLESGIRPAKDSVTKAMLARKQPHWSIVVVSPVPPIVTVSVYPSKFRWAKRAIKHVW